MKLAEQTAKPVAKGTAPINQQEAEALARDIPQWRLDNAALNREFRFKNFREAMEFANQVAGVANEQDHHPDIFISYNIVRLTLSTHKINGLSLNDFIVAAKIDLAANRQQAGRAA